MAIAPQRGINDTDTNLSWTEEQYSEFANKKCDDIDLLTVAHKIADHCEYIEINEIGRGLGLNESAAQKVAKQHEHSPYGDMIHELLLQWKEKAATIVAKAVTADTEAALTVGEAVTTGAEATTTAAKAVTAGTEAALTVGEAVTTGAEATATVGEAVTPDAEAATTAEDTWANLMPLLHSIFNSEPLMKGLSDYLHQKVDPNPENGKSCMHACHLITLHDCICTIPLYSWGRGTGYVYHTHKT